jgi:hypothetical protein
MTILQKKWGAMEQRTEHGYKTAHIIPFACSIPHAYLNVNCAPQEGRPHAHVVDAVQGAMSGRASCSPDRKVLTLAMHKTSQGWTKLKGSFIMYTLPPCVENSNTLPFGYAGRRVQG